MEPEKVTIGPHTLYLGDCVDVMPNLNKGSFNFAITSPPYDELRTYGEHGANFDFYGAAWNIKRLLDNNSCLVWIVADQVKNGSETGTSFKQALHFRELGLNIHDTMIWEKGVVAFPESVRYNQKMEYMFVFSKGRPTFNGIKDHKNVSAGRVVTGKDRNKDGSFKKRTGEGNVCPEFSLRGNVWKEWNQQRGIGHPAIFPVELVKDHVRTWTNEEEHVIDPFMGSGTTGVACAQLGRIFTGIERERKYFDVACERIARAHAQGRIFDEPEAAPVQEALFA